MICPDFNNPAVKKLATYYSDEAIGEIFMKLQTPEFIRWFGNFDDKDPNMQTAEQAEEYVAKNKITILDIDDDFNIYNLLGEKESLDKFITISDNNGVKTSLIELKDTIDVENLKKTLLEKSKNAEIKEGKYVYNGKKLSHRTTDFVKKYFNRLFNNPDKDKEDAVNIYALKGTILHLYNKLIIEDILDETNLDYDQLNTLVYEELKDKLEFSEYKDSPEFFKLQTSVINDINDYFYDLISEIKAEDPNATFFPELILVNETEDMGGTVDLLVLKSNGEVYIYDWKSMLENSLEEDNEIKQYKKEAFSIQLNLYRDTLITEYGVPLNKIVRQRAIPIIVQLKRDKKQKGGLNTTGGYSLFSIGELDPQPSFNEITKFEDLNNILESLFFKRNQILTDLKNNSDDPKLNNDLKETEKLIKDIQLNYDISGVYENIRLLQKRFTSNMKLYEDKSSSSNTAEILKEFVEINKELVFFEGVLKNLSRYITNRKNDPTFINDEGEEAFKENSSKIKTLNQRILSFQSYISNVFKSYLKNSLEEKNSPIDLENITESGLLEIAQQKSDIKNPVIQAFFELIVKESESEKYLKLKEFKDKILDYKAKIIKYAKDNNLNEKQVMDLFLNVNKDLVGIFSDEYREDLIFYKRALNSSNEDDAAEALEWMKENSEFNTVEYEIFKKKAFKIIEQVNETEEEIAFAKEDFEERYDVTKHDSAYNISNKFIRGKREAANLNPRYLKIFNDPNLKSIHDGLEEFNAYARQVTGRKIDNNFAPNVTLDLAASIIENGGSLSNIPSNLLSTLKNSFTTTVDEDTFLGSISTDGTRKHTIPVFFTKLFLPELTEKQIKEIEDNIDKKLVKDSIEYDGELLRAIYAKRNKLAVENKSSDFLSNFLLFAESVFNYEALNDRLDTLYALKNFSENKATFAPTTITSKSKLNKATGKFLKISGMSKEGSELLEAVENEYVYGQKIQTKDHARTLDSGRTLSLNKSILSIMNYFSINALGFKPILGLINGIGVRTNFNSMVREGVYMDKESAKKSLAEVVKDKNKFFGFAEYMGTDPKGTIHKAKQKAKQGKFSKIVNTDTAYAFLSKPEELQANQGLIAMSLFFRVVNGKIINPNSLFRTGDTKEIWKERIKQFPTVYDLIKTEEVTLADGSKKINIKTTISDKELASFKLIVEKVTTGYTGNVAEYDKAVGNASIWYRVFMQMKNWIPPLLKQRTSKSRIDIGTNQIDIGRYAVFLGELFNKNSETLKSLFDFGKEIFFINNANKSIINKKVAEFYYKEWLETDFKNDIAKGKRMVSFEQFVKIRNDKFRANAYEARIVLLLILLIVALSGDWDDNGEENYKEFFGGKATFKVLNRAYNEITFFSNPMSAKTIIKGAVPMLVFAEKASLLLNNTFDETRDFVSIKTTGQDKKGINNRDTNDLTPSLYYSSWFLAGLNNLTSELDIPEKFSENIIKTQLTKEEKIKNRKERAKKRRREPQE